MAQTTCCMSFGPVYVAAALPKPPRRIICKQELYIVVSIKKTQRIRKKKLTSGSN